MLSFIEILFVGKIQQTDVGWTMSSWELSRFASGLPYVAQVARCANAELRRPPKLVAPRAIQHADRHGG
jgi:hypothetical protein